MNIQDNGKGFDTKIIESAKTIGLNSVKSRITALNGIVDINSEIDKGTEISVEFNFPGS